MKGVVCLFLAVIFITGVMGCDLPDYQYTSSSSSSSSVRANSTGNSVGTRPAGKWIFQEKTDDFDGKHYRLCLLESNDRISGHLYKTTPGLIVRQKNDESPEIILKAETTFNSNIFGEERIRIKFDDEQPFKVNFGNSSDGSLDTLFLRSASKILPRFETAKKLTIEFPVAFETGNRASFDLEGYSEICKFAKKEKKEKKKDKKEKKEKKKK